MSITTVKATFDGQEYTLTFNETTRKYETVIVPAKTSHMKKGDIQYRNNRDKRQGRFHHTIGRRISLGFG